MTVEQISLAQARRMALAAQGFGAALPTKVDAQHLRAMVDRLGVLQVDSVNAVCRSHYLPLFSRLGPYQRSSLDQMVWGEGSTRDLFEYFWGHRAAIMPAPFHRLLRWRMRAAAGQDWAAERDKATQVPSAVAEGMRRLSQERPGLVDDVLETIRTHGPLMASELQDPDTGRGPVHEGGRMWNWKDTKVAVEALFASGRLAISDRRSFERVYDVVERVIPAKILADSEPSVDESQRELVRIGARASGISTVRELCAPGRSYVSLPAGVGKIRVAELVEMGELIPTHIEGISAQYYRWHAAEAPARVEGQALLSPFDSLIWTRDRTEKLFGFHYRTSIYLPEAKRVDGYYVMPFLTDEAIVARVDVRADRKSSTFQVPTVNVEDSADAGQVSDRLSRELTDMARWLDLERVVVGDRGSLAGPLKAAVNA